MKATVTCLTAVLLTASIFCTQTAYGEIIWKAGFEPVANAEMEEANLTVDASGADNTFSFVWDGVEAKLVNPEDQRPNFTTGRVLEVWKKDEAKAKNRMIGQIQMQKDGERVTFGKGSVMILSFDVEVKRTNLSINLFTAKRKRATDPQDALQITANDNPIQQILRVLVVANQTDAALPLPLKPKDGKAEAVPAGKVRVYLVTKGEKGLEMIRALGPKKKPIELGLSDDPIAGFAFQAYFSGGRKERRLTFDNLLISDNPKDTLGGVNVLALGPGADVNAK
jgi:hypothetical protein